jgi:hypothetical protein
MTSKKSLLRRRYHEDKIIVAHFPPDGTLEFKAEPFENLFQGTSSPGIPAIGWNDPVGIFHPQPPPVAEPEQRMRNEHAMPMSIRWRSHEEEVR